MATQQIPQIEVEKREHVGTRYARRLRQEGRLPAVIYGHKQDPVHVSLDRREFTDLLHHHTHLLEVKVDENAAPCLIKDVQWDHLGAEVVHVDLTRVDLTESVTVEVEIQLAGEPVGLKETGTILEQLLSMLEIECLATQIPEEIRVDVSHLNVGESTTVGDLALPEGVKATAAPETLVARVEEVRRVEEEEVVEEVEGEEPAVIGREAEDGVEGAAEAGADAEK